MKYFLLLIFFPVFSWADVTPDYLSQKLTSTDAQKTVTHLQQKEWDKLLAEVATGKEEWLKLIPALAKFTDANRSASLEDALAYSLRRNVGETLKVISILDANKYPSMIGSDIICVPPFEKSISEITDFYNATRDALLETDEGAKCLWILESSMEEWKRSDKQK